MLVMGTEPALEGTLSTYVKTEKLHLPVPTETMAISLDHSSTTVSGGSSPPEQQQQLLLTDNNRSKQYVSQLKDCILQKRRPKDGEEEDENIDTSPELVEDVSESSRWMDTTETVHNPVTPVIAAAAAPTFFNWPASNRNVADSPPAPTPTPTPPPPPTPATAPASAAKPRRVMCRQFWKAGDYEAVPNAESRNTDGIDHVRVHPKFLHSNATSHKWVLGAIAELLDNAMDEVKKGATYVNIDMLPNPLDKSPMLYIEDNGGGMTPELIRECMSLGFSTKSRKGYTIGQYGNGFKTSTMRLGADVVTFSRSPATPTRRATQSIGLLSYTFLRDSGQDDIIVPMIDYELKGGVISPMLRSTSVDWNKNLNTITSWSPFRSERELFSQFFNMTEKGTKIIIYNLWEDEHGAAELDFESDRFDIRTRNEEKDPRKIAMQQRFTYSKHYLLHQYSLRSYASILYYRHPPGFRIILRGQEVPHHNVADDLMETVQLSYKPQGFESSRDLKMVANVVMGFVKDAWDHIDVQGFNVYHKNRLIKPFWKVWNTAGSDGRGIVGVLEANFVEPAHDKQSFERTAVLARLELRLQQMQKQYWSQNCHLVGYVNKKMNRKARRQEAAAEMAELRANGGLGDGNRFGRQEPLQPRLSVPGFPIITPRVDISSPPVNDMGFQMVYRNRPSPNTPVGPPGFDLRVEMPVDRSGPGTPEVTTPFNKKFQWQGTESESPGDKTRENLPVGFETLEVMRKGAADPAALQGLLASMSTGPGQPYDAEIGAELEENKQLLARLQKLEQSNEQRLRFEVERNQKLEAQILDMEQQEAVDRRCLEQFTRERDNLREALAEERRLHEHDDEDMRKTLKGAMMRARELEAENHRLRMRKQT